MTSGLKLPRRVLRAGDRCRRRGARCSDPSMRFGTIPYGSRGGGDCRVGRVTAGLEHGERGFRNDWMLRTHNHSLAAHDLFSPLMGEPFAAQRLGAAARLRVVLRAGGLDAKASDSCRRQYVSLTGSVVRCMSMRRNIRFDLILRHREISHANAADSFTSARSANEPRPE